MYVEICDERNRYIACMFFSPILQKFTHKRIGYWTIKLRQKFDPNWLCLDRKKKHKNMSALNMKQYIDIARKCILELLVIVDV